MTSLSELLAMRDKPFETPLRIPPFSPIGKTSEGRNVFENTKGGVSSEFTITVSDPRINQGLPTLIPSIFNGRLVDQGTAIENIVNAGGVDPETGRKLPGFSSFEEADQFAPKRSQNIETFFNNRGQGMFGG